MKATRHYLPLIGSILLGALAIFALVPAQATEENDAEFFKAAAMSDMMEIESSKIAMQMATNTQVKSFAEMMVKDHTMASNKLKALAMKKNVTLPAALDEAHMKKLADLKAVPKGETFDEAYVDMQNKAHDDAVALFEKTSKDSKDADIRAHTTATLPTLKMHNEMVAKLDDANVKLNKTDVMP